MTPLDILSRFDTLAAQLEKDALVWAKSANMKDGDSVAAFTPYANQCVCTCATMRNDAKSIRDEVNAIRKEME